MLKLGDMETLHVLHRSQGRGDAFGVGHVVVVVWWWCS
jgi:hypothetical protein